MGSLRPVEFSLGVTNGTPGAAQAGRDNNHDKTILGRIGVAPLTGVRVGVSGATGAYLGDALDPALPTGASAERYDQRLAMVDLEWLFDRVELRAEGVASTWETPYVGNPTVRGYYLEGKYAFPGGPYVAARWDELRHDRVTGAGGVARPWDADVRRFEGGVGYRLQRDLVAKAVYQTTTLDPGPTADAERRYDQLAGQLSIGF